MYCSFKCFLSMKIRHILSGDRAAASRSEANTALVSIYASAKDSTKYIFRHVVMALIKLSYATVVRDDNNGEHVRRYLYYWLR